MKLIDKHLKYITVYAGITYAIGFLILSTRLASLHIYIKDFLTLDYLKTGILFIILNLPIYILSKDVTYLRRRKYDGILIHSINIILCIAYMFFLKPHFFEGRISKTTDWTNLIPTFIIYPIWIYFYLTFLSKSDIEDFKKDGFKLGLQFMFAIISINFFSNVIYPQVKFKLGGGAPYDKTLFLKVDSNKEIKYDATIYYENENWIYSIKEDKVTTIPKNQIIKEEAKIKETFLLEHFN